MIINILALDLQSAPVTCLLADYQRYQLHELLEKKEDNANVRFEVLGKYNLYAVSLKCTL